MKKKTRPMPKWLVKFKRFVEHPLLNISAGAFLVATGLFEGFASIYEELADVPLGGHHGVIVFGLIHILRTLPDGLHGLQYVEEAEEEFEHERELVT